MERVAPATGLTFAGMASTVESRLGSTQCLQAQTIFDEMGWPDEVRPPYALIDAWLKSDPSRPAGDEAA